VWPELSELPFVAISCCGYGKGKEKITAFVCLVEFFIWLPFYASLCQYPVYFVSGFCGVFFFPDFIHYEFGDLQKEKKIALKSSYQSSLCCVHGREWQATLQKGVEDNL